MLLAELKRRCAAGQPIAPATLAAAWGAAAERGEAEGRFFTALAARLGIGRPVADAEARQAFASLAGFGHLPAMYQLAMMLQTGAGGPEDDAGAKGWFARAAGEGYAAAQGMMAQLEALDRDKSRAWLLKAASQGLPKAQALLGARLYFDDDTREEGRRWLLQAARAGSAQAAETLSHDGETGITIGPRDIAPEELHWMRVAADAGLPTAQLRLGKHLLEQGGAGVPDGLAWIERAAEVDVNAAEKLATLYEDGKRIPRDAAKSARWYARAMARGNRLAIFGLLRLILSDDAAGLPFAEIVPLMRREADRGNMVGLHAMARLHQGGWGVPQDTQAALRDYRLAGEAGDAGALIAIGRLHADGEGVPRNDAEAVAWFEKAKATGNGLAANVALARMAREGRGTPKDPARALRLLEEADQRDLGEAAYELGALYERGLGVPVDLEKAKRYFERAARNRWPAARSRLMNYVTVDGQLRLVDGAGYRQALERRAVAGDAAAQLALSQALLKGEGGPQDVDGAVMWLTRAAERGHAPAQLALAQLLGYGVEVERDQRWVTVHRDAAASMRWYRELARQGTPEMKLILASRLEHGDEADQAEAFRWTLEAAQAGHADGQLAVAEMYAYGRGTPIDGPQAIAWAEKAVKQGHKDGHMALWRFYSQGTGVPKDPAKGLPHLIQAAEAGDEWAMIRLAEAYEAGTGVDQDWHLAARWYARAAQPWDSGRGGFGAANIYLNGPAGVRDAAEAHRWYLTGIQHWVEGGDGTEIFGDDEFAWFKERYGDLPTAQFALGRRFEQGDGLEKDLAQARDWYARAASFDRKYPAVALLAHLKVSTMAPPAAPRETDTPTAHLDKAVALVEHLAENPFRVITSAGANWPFDQAFPRVVAALRQAAEGGDGRAAYELAWLLRHGRGVPRNGTLAAQWNALACQAGYFPARAAAASSEAPQRTAMLEAVLAYQDRPDGLPALWRPSRPTAAYEVALKGLDAALKAGKLGPHAPPRRDDFSVSMVSVHDKSLSREALAAFAKSADMTVEQAAWFWEAARLEHRARQSSTAQAGFKWLRESAEMGWAPAMAGVGDAYLRGEGVGRDEAEAIKWHTLAVSLGADDWALEQACEAVSPRAIAQGEAAATAWWTSRHRVSLTPPRGKDPASPH
ncbi:putative beta-lactamase HcpC precursor [compost metagenome]